MSARLPYDPSAFPTWDPKFPFDLAIAYQDAPTRERAEQLYQRLFDQLEGEYDFQVNWWRLDELAEASLRDRAADAAARADMIILSLRANHELEPVTNAWIEVWLALKEDRKSALVALIYQPGFAHEAVGSVRDYLQTVARLGRMDFFFHAADWTPELPYSLHAIRERAHTITPALEESLTPRFLVPKLE